MYGSCHFPDARTPLSADTVLSRWGESLVTLTTSFYGVLTPLFLRAYSQHLSFPHTSLHHTHPFESIPPGLFLTHACLHLLIFTFLHLVRYPTNEANERTNGLLRLFLHLHLHLSCTISYERSERSEQTDRRTHANFFFIFTFLVRYPTNERSERTSCDTPFSRSISVGIGISVARSHTHQSIGTLFNSVPRADFFVEIWMWICT